MKLIFGVMYFHRHNTGGGGMGRLSPLIENKHIRASRFNTDIQNRYFRYTSMGFRRI